MLRSLFRRPRKVNLAAENGTVGIQRVEVSRKPRSSPTRIIVNGVLFYCAYRTLVLWIYGPDPEVQKRFEEIKKAQAQKKAKADIDKIAQPRKSGPKPSDYSQQQHEAFANAKGFGHGEATAETNKADETKPAETPIVIIIPGWIKELEGKIYEDTSPEVQAFQNLAEDEKATKKLHVAFDNAILKQIKSNKAHLGALKLIEFNGSFRRDLNWEPIFVAPPTYAIKSIVVRPDGITLEWKELDETAGARMAKMRQPVVVSRAFIAGIWAFTTTTAALAQAKALDYLYPAKKYHIIVEYVKHGKYQILRNQKVARTQTNEEKVIKKLPTSRLKSKDVEKAFPFLKGDVEEDSIRSSLRSHVKSLTHEHALQHSVAMFKREWVKGQLAAQRETTRGAINVSGFYDFTGGVGNHARYRVEVAGTYVPGDDVLIGPPQIIRTRVLHDMAQSKKSGSPAPGKSTTATASAHGNQQGQKQPIAEAKPKDAAGAGPAQSKKPKDQQAAKPKSTDDHDTTDKGPEPSSPAPEKEAEK